MIEVKRVKEVKVNKTVESIIRFYKSARKLNSLLLGDSIYPFMLIISFTIVMPIIKSSAIGWLFAFFTMVIALELMFNRIEIAFRSETNILKLIDKNKETIQELQKDIKLLRKRYKRKLKKEKELIRRFKK